MILAIDMGNTNIKIGMADLKDGSIREERLTTDKDRTSATVRSRASSFFMSGSLLTMNI